MSVRFRIHENKQATLAGVNHRDLRSVFDAAAIHYHEEVLKLHEKMKRHGEQELSVVDREYLKWVTHQLGVLETIRHGVDDAIAATYPPALPPTKAQRFAVVRAAKEERDLLDKLVVTMRETKKRRTSQPAV